MNYLFHILCWILSLTLVAQQRPDLVLYIADDLSATDVSLYGDSRIATPNLETLAAGGMRFERAFVASPACAPSRAALLTGLMPVRNGADRNHSYPRADLTTLTHYLRELGYEVASFGKVAHGRPDSAGIEYYHFDHFDWRPGDGLPDRVAAYLEQRTDPRPLCLLVGDRRPHVPWIGEATYASGDLALPGTLLDTPETREHWARYATDITGMDRDLGRVMALADQYLGENHLTVFSADHGSQWPFGKWNLYDYGIRVPLVVKYPGTVPAGSETRAMVSWVDIFPTLIDVAGGTVPDTIDGRSFAPVFTAPPEATHRELIFTSHHADGRFNIFPMRSVRSERFKYIRNQLPDYRHSNHSDIYRKDGAGAYWDSWDAEAALHPRAAALLQSYYRRPAEELFDLNLDPLERHNLIDDTLYADVAEQLRDELDAWLEELQDPMTVYGDPYPGDEPPYREDPNASNE